jgi:hypothetical protein
MLLLRSKTGEPGYVGAVNVFSWLGMQPFALNSFRVLTSLLWHWLAIARTPPLADSRSVLTGNRWLLDNAAL